MKHMKSLLVLLALSVLLAGCGKTEPVTEASPEETVTESSTAETKPTETIAEEVGDWERYQIFMMQYLTENWVGPDDTWEKGEYTEVEEASIDIWSRGFKEIELQYAERELENGPRKITDIEYYIKDNRVHLLLNYVLYAGTEEEISQRWEIHMENTNEPIDISGVGNPDTSTIHFPYDTPDGLEYNHYTSRDGVDVWLYYAPRTGNMYSYQIKDREPYTMHPYIVNYWTKYLPLSVERDFVLTMGSQTKTYRYTIGTTFGGWVFSDYNKDGWHYSDDKEWVVSANGKFAVRPDIRLVPNITAEPYPAE